MYISCIFIGVHHHQLDFRKCSVLLLKCSIFPIKSQLGNMLNVYLYTIFEIIYCLLCSKLHLKCSILEQKVIMFDKIGVKFRNSKNHITCW